MTHRPWNPKSARRDFQGRKCDTRGFTVVEVLIALAICAMMSVVLVASYMNILNAYDAMAKNPRRNLDVRFARNALLAEADFETAQKGDQLEGASGRHITWTSIIEPTSTANLFQVTFTCEISAGDNPGDKEETVTEVFRVLRPTWANTSGFSPDAATLRAEARDRITQAQQPSPLSGLGPSSGSVSGGSSGGSTNTGRGGGASINKNSGGRPGGTTGGGGAPKR